MGFNNFVFNKVEEIEGLFIITPLVADDCRGVFTKTFELDILKEHGIDFNVKEINESISKKGVIRGLHMQHTFPQAKLARVTRGSAMDVAVDVRRESPTFGKYFSVHLSEENKKMFYIPGGFLHGIVSLEDNTVLNYACSERYYPQYDGGVRWDDKDINVAWPYDKIDNFIVSEKDKNMVSFKEYIKLLGLGEKNV